MTSKPFWTTSTIRVLVGFFTLCMVVKVGWVDTAAFYVVILGVWFACKILAKEQR